MTTRYLSLALMFACSICRADSPECRPLDSPASYYNKPTKSYLLATDSCLIELFSKLGLTPKKKPPAKTHANVVDASAGFPNNAFYYSEKLKTNFEASSEDNVFSAVVTALGLKRGQASEDGYSTSERNLIREVQICCDVETTSYVSCLRVENSDYYSGRASASRCLAARPL